MAEKPELASLIKRSQVRIRKPGGGIAGCGWLAPGNVIITCAHVIQAFTENITFEFPLLQNKQYKTYVDLNDDSLQQDADVEYQEDIAILRLPPGILLPDTAKPAPISAPDEAWFDREVTMQGYPKGWDDGVNITGYLAGPIKGRVQFDHDLKSQVVAKGFSGAAVWDKRNENVVGMVVGKGQGDEKTAGYMIPIGSLVKAWEPLLPKKSTEKVEKPKFVLLPNDHIRCDRGPEYRKIKEFFKETCKGDQKQPLLFIIHGDDGAAHNSLVKRFKDFCITKFFERKYNEPIEPELHTLPMENMGDLEESRDVFIKDLLEEWEEDEVSSSFTAENLCGLPGVCDIPVIMLAHIIDTSVWDQDYEKLIKWYVNDFWAPLKNRTDIPQFLIFLNYVYPAVQKQPVISRVLGKAKRSKQIVDQHIKELAGNVDSPCRCGPITKLSEVTRKHVEDWFVYFNIDQEVDTTAPTAKKARYVNRIDVIFGNKATSCRCMTKVEASLKQIVDAETQKRQPQMFV